MATISDIEEGEHTLYLKDQNGTVVAQKAIEIKFSDSYYIEGSTIYVRAGRSFRLNIQYDGEKLILLSVDGAGPATGDEANAQIWVMFSLLSCAGLYLLNRQRKRI